MQAFLAKKQVFLAKIIICKWPPITPTPNGATLRIGNNEYIIHRVYLRKQLPQIHPQESLVIQPVCADNQGTEGLKFVSELN